MGLQPVIFVFCVVHLALSQHTRWEDEPGMRIIRYFSSGGYPLRTVIIPREAEDDPYIMISNSSLTDRSTTEAPRIRFKRKWSMKTTTEMPQTLPQTSTYENRSHANLTERNHNVTKQEFKIAKFLNLFTVVRFANEACREVGGTCYHDYECKSLGGKAHGPCAEGYGVCCHLESKCGTTTSMKSAVLTNKGSLGAGCEFTVEKLERTRQIRLDFLQLELGSPREGNCMVDRLTVKGVNKNLFVPVLCGFNTGQHMNLDMDDSPGPLKISVISSQGSQFKIQVRQLFEGDQLLAPANCLQYYTGAQGSLESFNYMEPPSQGTYLNNLNYAICIKKEPDHCSIMYKNVSPDGDEFAFEMNNVDQGSVEESEMTVPRGQAGTEMFSCPHDFISISSVRLCGQKLNDARLQVSLAKNAPIIDDTQGPFMVSVKTNEAVTGRGFRLTYEQLSCP